MDVTDLAAIEARPVSGALLRYELPGDHVEAEIFPWQTRPYAPSVPATQVSFTAALMTPLSRGRVALTPDGGAEVRVRHLADGQDAARMAEIVATTAGLVDELAARGLVRVPDDAWWRADDLAAAARRVAGTYNHHCGTCRMGDPSDLRAVVSPGPGRARHLRADRGGLLGLPGHPAGQHQPGVDDDRPPRRPAPAGPEPAVRDHGEADGPARAMSQKASS